MYREQVREHLGQQLNPPDGEADPLPPSSSEPHYPPAHLREVAPAVTSRKSSKGGSE